VELEIWKVVPDTNDLLFVSNRGGVKSESFSYTQSNGKIYVLKAKVKKLTLGNNGYYHFRFKGKQYLLHRAIGLAFIPNPNNEATINHKDGDKLNNDIDNLEWVSYGDNSLHALRTGLRKPACGLRGSDNHLSKLSREDVNFILDNFKKVVSDRLTQAELARMFEVSSTAILKIRRGVNWKYLEAE
jgi:hypothetical protein